MRNRQDLRRSGDPKDLLAHRAVFRQSGAARAGVGSHTLYRLVERGTVERVGHGLVDDVPARVGLALPRGSGPLSTVAPVVWHHFDPATFEVDRASVAVEGSEERTGLYGAGASPAALMGLAERLPRARGPVRQALEHRL